MANVITFTRENLSFKDWLDCSQNPNWTVYGYGDNTNNNNIIADQEMYLSQIHMC